MKELLETLIKEKGLWREEMSKHGFDNARWEIVPAGDSKESFQVRSLRADWVVSQWFFKNIWHIDTLRDVCRAKWGDKIIEVSGYFNEVVQDVAWQHHFHKLIDLESPQEREQYLLSN